MHGTQTAALPTSYQRYLEKTFRRELDLHGTPIRIELRSGENPYAGKRNKLTQRQVERRRRMMSHIKKSEKKRATKNATVSLTQACTIMPTYVESSFDCGRCLDSGTPRLEWFTFGVQRRFQFR